MLVTPRSLSEYIVGYTIYQPIIKQREGGELVGLVSFSKKDILSYIHL